MQTIISTEVDFVVETNEMDGDEDSRRLPLLNEEQNGGILSDRLEVRSLVGTSFQIDAEGDSRLLCDDKCLLSGGQETEAELRERAQARRKLMLAICLAFIFMCVEIVGGVMAKSLAIMTDAAHLLSDIAGFSISLFSLWMVSWEATPRHSFGYHRTEILGALMSIQLIWMITGVLIYEAISRIIKGNHHVEGLTMFLTASFGVVVNIFQAVLLGHHHGHDHGSHSHQHSHGGHGRHSHDDDHSHGGDLWVDVHEGEDHPLIANSSHVGDEAARIGMAVTKGLPRGNSLSNRSHSHAVTRPSQERDHETLSGIRQEGSVDPHPHRPHGSSVENINLKAAYIHVLGDMIQSVSVMIVGGLIWLRPEWWMMDLVCTLIFSVLVLGTTIKMLRDILSVLMESTPREIDPTQVKEGLQKIRDVIDVHELHIWAITVGRAILACHVRVKPSANTNEVLHAVRRFCAAEYRITHTTVQVER